MTEDLIQPLESKTRSIIKALTWQTVGFISTMIITFCFMGSLSQACAMTVFMTITALVLYFVHERCWQRVRWGRMVKAVNKSEI